MTDQPKVRRESTSEVEKVFPHSIFVPYDPLNVGLYTGTGFPHAVPYEYTGWRDETLAWKQTCYLHGNLNPTPTFRVRGPEAVKALAGICVNTFENFPIGTGKHGIMCTEQGLVMQDGVIIRLADDDFLTYWMAPYLPYALLVKGRFDLEGENLTGRVFLFQVAGPRSLEVLEEATGECLHDIEFMHHRMSGIDGLEVRILRMGMAGSLAYEVHGKVEDARPVYEAIYRAGEQFGIRKLGIHAYMMNHTENGFPQAYYHFPYPWGEDKGFLEFLSSMGGAIGGNYLLRGSMGPDISLRYRNPVELGWAAMIKFDHEFVGRAALEKMVAMGRRKMVSLEWNKEDVLDVYASEFRSGEPYQAIGEPSHFTFEGASNVIYADQVLADGKLVGVSSGRAHSYYYREMISLCSIDVEHSALGTDVVVLWGDPGTRQKEIRAKVARFPYFGQDRNEKLDVSAIACRAGA